MKRNNRLQYYIYILILVLVHLDMFSQNIVKQISNLEGLSNNSINTIIEDSDSKLWIGTWDGLNLYNGKDFRHFRYDKKNDNSISSNIIWQIIEQDSSIMWIATDNGINRFNQEIQKFDRFFLVGNRMHMGITQNNHMIFYDQNQGLIYFDDKSEKFISLNLEIKDKIKMMIVDSKDNVYLLTEDGNMSSYQISDKSGSLSISSVNNIKQAGKIYHIFKYEEHVSFSYDGYIEVLNINNKEVRKISFSKNAIATQLVHLNNNLYICFDDSECITYNLKSNNYDKVNIIPENTSIFSLYVGSQNILWIGTDGKGIFQLYDYISPYNTIQTNYPVRSIIQNDNSNILIGTKGEGILLFNLENNQIFNTLTRKDGLISNSVYVMKKNKYGDIFIGTEGSGINILRSNENKLEKLNLPLDCSEFKHIYSILFTNNDSTLWLGTTDYGLIRMDIVKKNNKYHVSHFKRFRNTKGKNSISNNTISIIVKSMNENELWIGTRGGGLNKFHIKEEKFDIVEKMDSKLDHVNTNVLSILNNITDSLLIGTSSGLYILERDDMQSLKEFGKYNKLINSTIHGIIKEANNNIWLSTNQGLFKIENTSKLLVNYTSHDGLLNDEFSDGAYYQNNDNILFFGGVNGLSYFNPAHIKPRYYNPNISLSQIKINNKIFEPFEKIKNNTLYISHNEQYVTLSFATHDYINNENCEYKYRILNFSDEWIYNGYSSTISITQLPPGNYKLEVTSTNSDRIWSDKLITLQLKIGYPIWLSTYAFIIYVIILSIVIYISFSIIRTRKRLNNKLMLENIEKHHQQKLHEEKLNFFTNVAHEFFTPLTLIYGPAQYLLEKSSLSESQRKYIKVIKDNSDRMHSLIKELMEFRKLESGYIPLYAEEVKIEYFVDYIIDSFTEIAEGNKIKFEITINASDDIIFRTDQNSLEKSILNLISNAFKYTQIGGTIQSSFSLDELGNLNFKIMNTGKGLTEIQQKQIFNRYTIFDYNNEQTNSSTGIGLNYTKQLIELLGGEISVKSILGKFVEFFVVIPPMELSILDEIKKNPANESSISKKTFKNRNNGITILVVEDEKDIRNLLKDILSPFYKILEASDGNKALDFINENLPDIIITDILMPSLDGIGLIDKLRSNSRFAHIPIISISAKTSIDDKINALNHGTDVYITKPFHPQHILSVVKSIVKRSTVLEKYFNSSLSSLTIKDGVTLHHEDEAFINEVVRYIEDNIEDSTINAVSISEFAGMSKASLYRKIKEFTNKTPSELITTIRLEYACKLLITTQLTVSEIIYKSGFANKSYFFRSFSKSYNLTPKEFRDREFNQWE